MRHVHHWHLALGLTLLASLAVGHALAQEDENQSADEPSADQTMQELMQQRAAPPADTATDDGPSDNDDAMPAMRVDIDPEVLGVAPGEPQPTLRREGEFIVNRVGRLRRSSESGRMLFVFDADDKDSPEPPMILQACRLLETMENLVQERGGQVTFKISGQVHTYRGANYLLPTMMRLEMDQRSIDN